MSFWDDAKDWVSDTFSSAGDFLWEGIESGLNFVTGGLYEYAKDQLSDFIEGLIPEQEFQDRQRTVRGGAEDRKIIYGTTRVGGQLVYIEDAAKDNIVLWMCFVIAGHECEEIVAVRANDEVIATSNGPGVNGYMNRTNNSFGNNTLCWSVHGNRLAAFLPSINVTSSDNSYNGTFQPPSWTTNHKLSYQTYVWIGLVFDDETFGDTGLPRFTFDVKGKNDIYDPRTGLNGFTDNQALCVLDALLWGRMFNANLSEIDLDAFAAAANLADENVTANAAGTEFEKRYTVNGSFSHNIRPIDLITSLSKAGAGYPFWLQGKWTYVPGAYSAPVMDFDESDLVGGLEFSAGPGKQGKSNVASGTYVDASQNYEVVGFPQIYVSDYVSQDGEVLEKDYKFPFTNSGTMARRLAKIDIEQSRYGTSANAVFKFRALRLTPGDRINFYNSRLGWNPKVFRVESSEVSWSSGVKLALREDAPEIYDWDETDALALEQPPTLSIPDGLTISAPSNLLFEESIYQSVDRLPKAQLLVSWPEQPSAEAYDIQYKLSSDVDWIDAGTFWQDNSIMMRDLVDGTYDVRVRSISALGRRSAWLEESYTLVGGTSDPVDSVTLTERANEPKHPDAIFSTIVVDTVAPADPTYSHSVIEYQETGEPDWFLVGPTDANGRVTFVVLSDGKTYNVRATPVSALGVRGGVVQTQQITVSNSINLDEPGVGDYLPAPRVNGLELTGQANDTEFTGGDAKFEWRKTTVEQWLAIGSEGFFGASGGTLDQYFRDYQVEVWADVDGVDRIIRTEFVLDPIYVYSFEKNAEDYARKNGEPGAWRSFELRVYCRGRLNQISAVPARLVVNNPPPAPLQNLSVAAGFNTISISYKKPSDLDFDGVQIWISQTQGFDPDTTEPTAIVSDNSYVEDGLNQGQAYYVRLRPFDEFGLEGAPVSAEFAVTLKTGTDLSGLSGWAYEVDPVDRDFIEANMADGAISLASALVAGELPNSKLADLAVTAAKLADSSVNLAGNKITGQLGQVNLADSAVTTSKLAELSITAVKLASSSVTAAKIANLAVGTAAIANAAITNAKIANLAVDTAQIADAAIEEAKIAALAVGTAAIQDLAVSNAKIQSMAAAKLTAGVINATETITAAGLIRAVDDINTPVVQTGIGPAEYNLSGVPVTWLLWSFNGTDVTFGVDEGGNPYFKGVIEASGFSNDFLEIDEQGNLTSTGTFRFGGSSSNYVEYDGAKLLVRGKLRVEETGEYGNLTGLYIGDDKLGYSYQTSPSENGWEIGNAGSFRVEGSGTALGRVTYNEQLFDGVTQNLLTLDRSSQAFFNTAFGSHSFALYNSDDATYDAMFSIDKTNSAGRGEVTVDVTGFMNISQGLDVNGNTTLFTLQTFTGEAQKTVSDGSETNNDWGFYSKSYIGFKSYSRTYSKSTGGAPPPNNSKGIGHWGDGGQYDFYAAGPGTNYAPFTGGHDALIDHGHEAEPGDIVVVTGKFWKAGLSQTVPEVLLSDSPKSKAIYGVFNQSDYLREDFVPAGLAQLPEEEYMAMLGKTDLASINAVGEGQINVCSEGGDIEIGDFVCTSSRPGKGMRCDGNDMRYVVARVLEPDSWEEDNDEVKQVACIYLCG